MSEIKTLGGGYKGGSPRVRSNNTKTYVAPNIAFVCSKCNSDKCSMSLRQMKRVRDVAKERGLIN